MTDVMVNRNLLTRAEIKGKITRRMFLLVASLIIGWILWQPSLASIRYDNDWQGRMVSCVLITLGFVLLENARLQYRAEMLLQKITENARVRYPELLFAVLFTPILLAFGTVFITACVISLFTWSIPTMLFSMISIMRWKRHLDAL